MAVPTSLFVVLGLCAVLPLLAGQSTNVTAGRPPRIVEHPEDAIVSPNGSPSLQCRADGNPQPTITWYKDGKLVTTARENYKSNRVILSNGILFLVFDERYDTGTYTCNATNAFGSAISQSAVLEVASLSTEFQVYPEDARANVDEMLALYCRAPVGRPEAQIKWKKNGEIVVSQGRIQIIEPGTLQISSVQKSDAGSYICVAENSAGTRETPAVTVSIIERPKLIRLPENLTAVENEEVTIDCRATGDPQPAVFVFRADGRPIDGRGRYTERGLLLQQLRLSDDGVYVCRAENEAGKVEVNAKLTVQTIPSFSAVPRDITAQAGSAVELPCVVTGLPLPIVYWSSDRVSNQLIPGQRSSDTRFTVNADGTLIISRVEKEDEGVFTCNAISMTGRAQTSATLTVSGSVVKLPPIIEYGPQNLSLPRGAVATLPCTSTGLNESREWLKDNVKLPLSQRVTLLRNGSLQITGVQPSDAGLYTCELNNTGGTTAWSAQLVVHEFDASLIAGGDRASGQLLATLPAAPSKPIFTSASRQTVTMLVNSSFSGVQLRAEFFSPQWTVGTWKPVTSFVPIGNSQYMATNLHPDFVYYFVVRFANTYGVGAASPVTAAVRTDEWPEVYEEKLSRVNKVSVNMQLDVVEATSAKVSWQLSRNPNSVIPYDFYIKVINTPKSNGERSEEREIVQRTLVSRDSLRTATIIEGLRPYTTYEVRVQAGFQNQRSLPSMPLIFLTREAAPAGAPRNISVDWLSSEQLVAQWLAPRVELQNGIIVSYRGRLLCLPRTSAGSAATHEQIAKAIVAAAPCNDSRLSHFMVESTHITLSGLDKSVRYVLQMAAATRFGIGLYSDPLLIDGDHTQLIPLDSTPLPPLRIESRTETVGLATASRASVVRSSEAAVTPQEQPILLIVIIVAVIFVCGFVGAAIFLCRRPCRSPPASKSFVLSVQTSGMSGPMQMNKVKGDSVALHPLLHNNPDASITVSNILEQQQQQRAAQKSAILNPNLIGSGMGQQHTATYADSYALTAMANNMDVSDSSATQLRAYVDNVLPAIVPIPPPQSVTSNQSQALTQFGMQNGMVMNAAVFRPIAVHAMQDTYESEYAPLLPVSPPHMGSGGVDMSVSSQTAQSQRSTVLTQRNSVSLKNGTKQSSSSSSSSSHLNAASRKVPGCNQSPQLMRVKDFLPPPPPPRDPHMMSPNSGLPSEAEMDQDTERECATSNPLHYQSTTSRGSSASGAPQPLATHIEMTPYASNMMVNMFGSNGQLLGQWPSTAVTNGYSFTLSACANDGAACTNELDDATSRDEDGVDEDEDEDEDENLQTDADMVDGGAMDESDITSLMLEADYDSVLKRTVEVIASAQINSSQRSRDAEDQIPLVQMGKNTSSLPKRRFTGTGNSALPQVLENHPLQQPSFNAFGPGHGPAANYAQMQAAFAMQQRASSPYSSDNSTYGIVLPTKPGPNLLLPAGQQPARPPRKRRTQSGSQKFGFSTSEGKDSPTAATDMNANSNAHAPNTANMQLA